MAEHSKEDMAEFVKDLVAKGAQRGYALGARDMLDSIEDELSDRYDAMPRYDRGVLLELMPFMAELRAGVNEVLESTGGVE